MCAVLCGIDSLNGIINYAGNKKEFLLNDNRLLEVIKNL